MKKIFALILSIALMASLSLIVFAEGQETATISIEMWDDCGDDWYYEGGRSYIVALSKPIVGDSFDPDESTILAKCSHETYGEIDTITFTIGKMQTVYFYWLRGHSYPDEAGFAIYRDGVKVYEHESEYSQNIWSCTLKDGECFFTSEFVDARGTTVSYNVSPTYTVTIPTDVTIGGGDATVSVEDVIVNKGQYVSISLAADNDFTVTTPQGATLEYTVTANGEAVAAGGEILAVNPSNATDGSAEIAFAIDEDTIQYAGKYTGTATFTVAVKDVPVTTISFTIDGEPYQADAGMTWAQWVGSASNTIGLYLSDGADGVYWDWYCLFDATDAVKASDVIEAEAYTLIQTEG